MLRIFGERLSLTVLGMYKIQYKAHSQKCICKSVVLSDKTVRALTGMRS